MNKRLFVGNLPYEFTEDDLRNLFSSYGEVSYAKIITDRETGRSKGFGFVELPEEAATQAISEVNGKKIGSEGREREIVCNEAKPMEDRGPRRDFGGQRRDFGGDRGGRGGDRGGRDRNFRGGGKSW
jgi:RNA recognition motif-containing protein